MLELKDFFHLPEVDQFVGRLAAIQSGLIVVAGYDPLPGGAALQATQGHAGPAVEQDDWLPSGRAAIFRIVLREWLAAHTRARAVIIAATRNVARLPDYLQRRVQTVLLQDDQGYAECITAALAGGPDLLVVDELNADNATALLQAAGQGLPVLAQFSRLYRGPEVLRVIRPPELAGDMPEPGCQVIAVQRMRALCPHCRHPAPLPADLAARLHLRHPDLTLDPDSTFFAPAGCERCQHTGWLGSIALFDLYASPASESDLPLEVYAWRLAALGHVSAQDAAALEERQWQRTYALLDSAERALAETQAALHRKQAELEVAQRVLQQRTEALFSLEAISQALIRVMDLRDLATEVCQYTSAICEAERVILYYLRPAEVADVLAFVGWDAGHVAASVEAGSVTGDRGDATPAAFSRWPPGVQRRHTDVEGVELRSGLRVPLVAQDEWVGVMIVQTWRRHGFAPGQVALLQTFARQAALALHRAGLIEQLRHNIRQLQAAQVQLVQKERMERELELARQVQQSVLPRSFPHYTGYTFAARNEPARQVGGDFYDVIRLDDRRFGLMIADVSDKGMPAALYMALARSLIVAEARRTPEPAEVLHHVNRLLLELSEPRLFVTVFYGVVDTVAAQLLYVRAGHDRPLLVRQATVQELPGQGALLGLLEETELRMSTEQIDLMPGDRLVLYTDGLIDAESPDGKRFGIERLHEYLKAGAQLSPAGLCHALFERVTAFQADADQFDDITLLVVSYEPTH